MRKQPTKRTVKAWGIRKKWDGCLRPIAYYTKKQATDDTCANEEVVRVIISEGKS